MGPVTLEPVMKHGFYNQNSSAQNSAMQQALPMLQQAVLDIALPRADGVLQILDQGCAQGSNSVAPVRSILDSLYQRLRSGAGPDVEHPPQLRSASAGPDRQQQLSVMVMHEDLQANDFASLLRVVADKDGGYLHYADGMAGLNVYSSVIGRSAYTRLVPDSYLHLTFSFAMMQWLSQPPAARPTRTFFSTSPAAEINVREAFRQQAHDDMKQLLMFRGAETHSGGALVALMPALTPGGALEQQLADVLQPMFEYIIQECGLSAEEVGNMCIPVHFRTAPEIQAVLDEVQHVWTVKRFEMDDTAMPSWQRYTSGQLTAADYATAVAGLWRALLESSFAAGLSRTRSPAVVQELLQQIFDVMTVHMTANPRPARFTSAFLYLSRTSAAAEASR